MTEDAERLRAASADLARRIADARAGRWPKPPVATAEQMAGSSYLGGMGDDEAWTTFAPGVRRNA